jgi:hypothetical protein
VRDGSSETVELPDHDRQGEIWLNSLANRKRNPLEKTTIDTRRYALDKWIYPFFDGRFLG